MAVSVSSASVGSVADVVTQFQTLLLAAGWLDGGGGSVEKSSGATTFSLSGSGSGISENLNGWTLRSSIGQVAGISQRRTTGSAVGSPAWDAPTKLWIFTDPSPADGNAWAAGVIQFGYNAYRHFYFGYIAGRIGGFTGGEIISGTHCHTDHVGDGAPDATDNYAHQRLFTGNCAAGAAWSGSANIVHSANPNSIRIFGGGWEAGYSNPPSYFFTSQSRIIGGIGDEVNDGYLDRSPSMFGGGFTLVPLNLYIDGVGGYFQPVGYPPGVRACLIIDPSPEAILTIAGKNWQVFPVFKKQTANQAPGNSTGWYDESSWYFGLAYEAT